MIFSFINAIFIYINFIYKYEIIMDIKDLKYYCKLIETKSYSSTADYFNVTQPTISAMLKRLEKELQAKLIFKTTRSPMHITHVGLVTYQHAKVLLLQVNKMNIDIERAKQHNFRLGYSELAGRLWLPQVIKELNRGKLLAHIETYQENSERLRKRLLQGYFDAIVYSKLETEQSFGIKENILGEHQFKFLVPTTHPLSTENKIDIYQIADTPLIMRHHNYLSNVALQQIFNKTGFQPKRKLFIDNIEAMLELVESQMGIGFIMDANIKLSSKTKLIPLIEKQEIKAYTCLGIRKDFLPNTEQQKYLNILMHPLQN